MDQSVASTNGVATTTRQRVCTIAMYHPNTTEAARFKELIAIVADGNATVFCQDILQVQRHYGSTRPSIVIVPLHDICSALLQQPPGNTRVIVWDEHGQASTKVLADLLRRGVRDVVKGDIEKLQQAVRRQIHQIKNEPARTEWLLELGARNGLIGRSRSWLTVLAQIKDASAQRHVPVLLYGESGTGKELVAHAVHRENEQYRAKPFLAVNCATVKGDLARSALFGHKKGSFTGANEDREGFFQKAQHGTLFLDEIQSLELETQALLLRAIDQRQIMPVGASEVTSIKDIRLIVATNEPLESMVMQGRFREDLYYRLAVIKIDLPPLRERPSDIVLLAHHLLTLCVEQCTSPVHSFAPEVLDAFQRLHWTGNVRELANAIVYAVVNKHAGEVFELSDLPLTILENIVQEGSVRSLDGRKPGADDFQIGTIMTFREAVGRLEKWLILRVLDRTGGNQSKAARILQITRGCLRAKMRQHGIFIETDTGIELPEIL